MSHVAYVIVCYAMTALVVAALIAWVIGDARGRRRDLAELEAAGIRRRSSAQPGGSVQ